MKKISLVLGLTLGANLLAGDLVGKYAQRATSEPISVVDISDNSGFYLGLGFGKFKIKNLDLYENAKSNVATVIAGYNINNYIGLEARYYKGLGDLNYNSSTKHEKINSRYTNISIFAKFQYPIDNFNPYVLLGYGVNKISNLNHSNRKESGFEYGVGVSYKVTKKVSVFADYIITHNKKEFDGRGKKDKYRMDLMTVGAAYNF